MSKKAFGKMMRGLEETKAYSDSFGFSLDTVKHWEGGRRTPEVPARAYLTVIQRNPSAVLEALHSVKATGRSRAPAESIDPSPEPRGS